MQWVDKGIDSGLDEHRQNSSLFVLGMTVMPETMKYYCVE